MPILSRLPCLTLLAVLSLTLSACGDKPASAQAPGGAPPPPEVGVLTVSTASVAVSTELPGRVEPTRVAQVRARVPGIVLQRLFREGGEVKAGEVLFKIDPAPYQAALGSADAALARAEANLMVAGQKAQRYKPLVESNAISKQEYDDVVATQKQAAADVAAAKAARETARLNLGYATVTAPISGRIGRALVTEGALVGQGEATPLAVVQQLDPIFVTLTQSGSELTKLQRDLAAGRLKRINGGRDAAIDLIGEDGQPYGKSGRLLFSEMTVDESTGAVILRAQFPNQDRMLLPGMYVRARLDQATREQAITVPQQAVQRTPDGASVMVVLDNGKVESRTVKTDGSVDANWIVSQGLKPGDKVIVDGLQKARPGATVKPVPWQKPGVATAAANVAAPAAAAPAASAPAAAPAAAPTAPASNAAAKPTPASASQPASR